MSIGNNLNSFGKATTTWATFTGILCIICLSIALLFITFKKISSSYKTTIGRVTNVTCQENTKNICVTRQNKRECENKTFFNCNYLVTYNVAGKTYTSEMNSSKTSKVINGSNKVIEYNTKNPNQIREPVPYSLMIGILGCICCIVSMSTMTNIIFSQSRAYRQVHGGVTGLRMVKSVFN